MKKSTKKLQLNKEVVASLDNEAMAHVKGGVLQFWTTGCTDGCGGFRTAFRCTKGGCTADCGSHFCPQPKPNSKNECPAPSDLCYTGECKTLRSDCGTSQCTR